MSNRDHPNKIKYGIHVQKITANVMKILNGKKVKGCVDK